MKILRQVKWPSYFQGYKERCAAFEPNIAWLKFKTKLTELCNTYIPSITIKSDYQLPWFDNETFKLCREK